MESSQSTAPVDSAAEPSVIGPGPAITAVDPDRFVSLVLDRDGLAEAVVVVVPIRDLPAATEGITDPVQGNGTGERLISEIVGRIFAQNRDFESSAQPHQASDDADAISEAEARVLRYLPTNLTAGEIAAALYLSTNTVKTHMRHIYAKLDAHRRREAVERARALGLLRASSRTRDRHRAIPAPAAAGS